MSEKLYLVLKLVVAAAVFVSTALIAMPASF